MGLIALRGNREYATGYAFFKGRFEILTEADEVLWSGVYSIPTVDSDLDIAIAPPVNGRKVRFTSIEDEPDDPGFAELEVFEP